MIIKYKISQQISNLIIFMYLLVIIKKINTNMIKKIKNIVTKKFKYEKLNFFKIK